ncbi:hypothetical protein BLTE_08440 [Blastochloris tepida]|uniref:TIGR02680 family protein n=1 Tax=Blastochloris tepida TaxID=2233851 RepID=A0A348FXX6_9HYPH|nr:hypothetical protein BLTE_08440 [Blastochloris tepida]
MKDAASLDRAASEAARRREAFQSASAATGEVVRRLARAREDVVRAEQRAEHGQRRLEDRRREAAADAAAAGLAAVHDGNAVAAFDIIALVALAQGEFDEAGAALATAARARREDIALLRRRRVEMERAEREHAEYRRIRDERQSDADAAEERRAQADADVEAQGANLVGAWERHCADLVHLAIEPDDGLQALDALAAWVTVMDRDNPARRLLQAAQQRAADRFAERAAALDVRRRTLEVEADALEDERRRLKAGTDPPPPPYTRDPDARSVRAGAPLWQLVDFRERATEAQRAGLEAALEASGLLDAWVSPEGRVETGDGGRLLHDTQLVTRPRHPSSLADWLVPAGPPESGVPADIVAGILSGIACTDDDVIEAEAWVAPDGRFRLGTLAGAWTKPAAIHVGHMARAAARARRLAGIAARLTEIAGEHAALQALAAELAADRARADDEWRRSPTEDALRTAHLAAAAAAREVHLARVRLAESEDRRGAAEQALKAARERLATDAADMRLPDSAEALMDVEAALDRYRDTLGQLAQAGHEVRLAAPELQRSRLREDEARADLEMNEERLGIARTESEEASARFETLRNAIGAKVDDLMRQMAKATEAAKTSESALDDARTAQNTAREARAVAGEQARSATEALQQKSEARGLAVVRWQQFAGTGLLAAAIPDLDLPDIGVPWTIDPALTLSRRAKQALSDLKDDDDAWSRVQKQLNEEFADLQRALGALGHQAVADVGDWGLVVHIVYQNRPERPDRLSARLADEIAQRGELLTAKEREVLENHLQAEIATGIQRLMQSAEAQRDAINGELYKRPTSTGVRFRLIWQTLDEEDGAPIGLDAARKRLLNTSADLWSAEDRAVVGAMLQRCIVAERERADSVGGGSLLDQLSAALDYRRWHRFRIERWQDGQWRKLSGPASSGERALGLTVPLFAAVSSFYGQGASAQAPRLILLDEAFAGIDDAARAHCMGLIHEFDLDFVLTSEREWACYAELPGVAICQLQRREGIDAVFVSRWTWDGRARSREADPDRRFAPA